MRLAHYAIIRGSDEKNKITNYWDDSFSHSNEVSF
jgi:hypothetical protein